MRLSVRFGFSPLIALLGCAPVLTAQQYCFSGPVAYFENNGQSLQFNSGDQIAVTATIEAGTQSCTIYSSVLIVCTGTLLLDASSGTRHWTNIGLTGGSFYASFNNFSGINNNTYITISGPLALSPLPASPGPDAQVEISLVMSVPGNLLQSGSLPSQLPSPTAASAGITISDAASDAVGFSYTGQLCSLCDAALVNVFPSFGSQYMEAAFVAPSLSTVPAGQTPKLSDYKAACGFASLNWLQTVTLFPAIPSQVAPNKIVPNIPSNLPSNVYPANCSMQPPTAWQQNSCTLVAGPRVANGLSSDYPAFYDPPLGGYYGSTVNYTFPYYYPEGVVDAVNYETNPVCTLAGNCPPFPFIVSTDGTTLSFLDDPNDPFLSNGQFLSFQTLLVGIDSQNGIHPLYSWTWTSNFNGTNTGGVLQTSSIYPIVPGSGTGGVTITSINAVPLPPVVPPSEIGVTASGLAYSRVSQTFNGTVTIRNIGTSTINGPLQILFAGMPPTVTLVNSTAALSGTPYITVPSTASLAPNQSVVVAVEFKNPSNATLNLTPVVYSGSIN